LAKHPAFNARKRRVTISDLAAHLGCTKGTVSRALNDYPDISEATRLRVRRAAEHLGYRPLSHAQAIRTGRSQALGFVLQESLHDGYRPFLSEFLAGMTQAASAEAWTVTVAEASTEADVLATFDRLLDERKVDGFILPRTQSDDPRIDHLRARDVPFVLYGRTSDPNNCAWYDIRGEAAMADAVGRLAALGHRRIAYLGGQSGYHYAKLRFGGFKVGMRDAELTLDEDLVRADAVCFETGRRATRALLSLENGPTAIVAAVDMGALGAYAAAAEFGVVIGRDLSIISYDGTPMGAWANPPLSTFAVDSRKAGRRLAALLIARIRGQAPEVLRELGDASFVARGSHGPCLNVTNDGRKPAANLVSMGGKT